MFETFRNVYFMVSTCSIKNNERKVHVVHMMFSFQGRSCLKELDDNGSNDNEGKCKGCRIAAEGERMTQRRGEEPYAVLL